MKYLLDQFVDDVGRAIEKYGITVEMQWSLGAKLQKLVQEGGDLTSQGVESVGSTGLSGRILNEEPKGRIR